MMSTERPEFYYAAAAVCHSDAVAMFGDKTPKQIKQCDEYVAKHVGEMIMSVTASLEAWKLRQ